MAFILNPFRFAVPAFAGAVTEFVNLGAEAGAMTGWTTTTWQARQVASGFPDAHAGSWYFWPGNNATATATQTITIDSARHAAIDAGVQYLELRWRARNADENNSLVQDRGRVIIECLSAADVVLGTIGPAHEYYPARSVWGEAVYRGLVPAATRKLRLILAATRPGSVSNDYYVDSVAVSWETAPAVLVGGDMGFRGLDAETGTLGWEVTAGRVLAVAFVTPHQGLAHFTGGNEAASEMRQDVPVPASRISAVDAGTQNVSLSWRERAFEAAGDEGQVFFTFLDASLGTLGTLGSARTRPSHTAWTLRSFSGAVPAGTRTIRLTYRADRTNGASNDYYVDDIQAAYV